MRDSIYENIGEKPKKVTVRLTPYQYKKLQGICEMFGWTMQRVFADFTDEFSLSYYDCQRGVIHPQKALKEAAEAQFDRAIHLHDNLRKPEYPDTPRLK